MFISRGWLAPRNVPPILRCAVRGGSRRHASPFPSYQTERYQMSNTDSHDKHTPNLNKPAVESVAGYRKNQSPAAAEFAKGASNLAEIKQATDVRRAHNEALSRMPVGPRTPGSRDNA
jgi:hypothetical protein